MKRNMKLALVMLKDLGNVEVLRQHFEKLGSRTGMRCFQDNFLLFPTSLDIYKS